MIKPLPCLALLASSVSLAGLQWFAAPAVASQVPAASPRKVGLASSAVASQSIRYRPPQRPGPRRTAGTGSRSGSPACLAAKSAAQTPLVPSEHVGQTLAARPTFFWYFSGTATGRTKEQMIRFSLLQNGTPKPLFEKLLTVSKPGIVQVSLPDNVPELVPDKDYRWSIAIVCNPNRPSETLALIQSFIQRTTPSFELTQQLANAGTAQARARIYAEAGIWYDALANLLKAYTVEPGNQMVQDDLLNLLSQVGITNVTLQQQRSQQATNP